MLEKFWREFQKLLEKLNLYLDTNILENLSNLFSDSLSFY